MSRYFLQDTPLAAWEREMMAVPGFGRRRVKQTDEESSAVTPVYELDFPFNEYHFPVGDGCFVGTLVMKRWNGRNGLNCFFDGANGTPYKLCVWNSYEDGRAYRPDYSDLDISTMALGTTLRVKFRATRSGKTKWLEAEILEVSACM